MMKTIYTFFALVLIAFSSVAQKKSPILPIPPDGIYLYDNLYMDQSLIANIHWLEFLHYAKDSGEVFYKSCLPDTTVWFQNEDYADYVSYHYLRYPGFRYYPVVGINHCQALRYCELRSKEVTMGMNTWKNNKWENYYIVIKYRLPTEEEWEYAASGGLDSLEYPYGTDELYIDLKINPRKWTKECYKVALQEDSTLSKRQLYQDIKAYKQQKHSSILFKYPYPYFLKEKASNNPTKWIFANPPNPYGFYNMVGNVAELIEDTTIVKGGSYQHRLEECQVTHDLPYQQPTNWIGFRCIAEVYLFPKEQEEKGYPFSFEYNDSCQLPSSH